MATKVMVIDASSNVVAHQASGSTVRVEVDTTGNLSVKDQGNANIAIYAPGQWKSATTDDDTSS